MTRWFLSIFCTMTVAFAAQSACAKSAVADVAPLVERVVQRAVLADADCVADHGETQQCYCVVDVAFPEFSVKAGYKNAAQLTQLLEDYREENIDDGVCPSNFTSVRKVNAQKIRDTAAMQTSVRFNTMFHTPEYVGLRYQFEEREGKSSAIRYSRGVVVDTTNGVVLSMPLLLGANQDGLLSDAATHALRAKVPGAEVLKFTQGSCIKCGGMYVTKNDVVIELAAGTVAPYEQGELTISLPLSYLHHTGLRKALGVK